jgi:hypothetical protein
MSLIKIVSETGVEQIRSATSVTFYPADTWQGSRVMYHQKGDIWCQTIDVGTVYVMSESGATLAKYVLGPSTIETAKRKAAMDARLESERKHDSAVVGQARFLLRILLNPDVACTKEIRHAAEVLQREIDTWNRHCR